MAGGPMDWWYWFGMWIAVVSSVVLTFWLWLDAFRRRGSISRFSWPLISFTGLVLQIPAFTIVGAAQAAGQGTAAAAAGLAGLTLVGISSIAYFSKGSGSGSTWFTRTRDNDSLLSGARERRPGASARASVPVGGRAPQGRTPRTPTPVDFSDERAAEARAAAGLAPKGAVPQSAQGMSAGFAGGALSDTDATIVASDDFRTVVDEPGAGVAAAGVLTVVADTLPGGAASDRTVVDDAEAPVDAATVVAEDQAPVPGADATLIAESDPGALTVVDETDAPAAAGVTIVGDAETDDTISDDPTFATVLDEPDGLGGRLVITDGRSSRIVITERTGPFIVGRDPAKSNLAVDDPKVSRSHLAISRVDDEYVISDLDSSNGTFVNGEMLREARVLQDGDTVEFGRTIAKFVIDGEAPNE